MSSVVVATHQYCEVISDLHSLSCYQVSVVESSDQCHDLHYKFFDEMIISDSILVCIIPAVRMYKLTLVCSGLCHVLSRN